MADDGAKCEPARLILVGLGEVQEVAVIPGQARRQGQLHGFCKARIAALLLARGAGQGRQPVEVVGAQVQVEPHQLVGVLHWIGVLVDRRAPAPRQEGSGQGGLSI